jgi:FAD/FMN-containing dehydrogenase
MMHLFETLTIGLLASLAQAAPWTKAVVEDCLAAAKVPFDVRNTTDWIRDATPFNLRLPYNPNAIAVPQTIEHIRQSVLCAKKLGVKVTPKSGGHSYASLGFGGEDGHLVVELDRMYNLTYDPLTEVATIQPGARLGHVNTILFQGWNRSIAHGTCPG